MVKVPLVTLLVMVLFTVAEIEPLEPEIAVSITKSPKTGAVTPLPATRVTRLVDVLAETV